MKRERTDESNFVSFFFLENEKVKLASASDKMRIAISLATLIRSIGVSLNWKLLPPAAVADKEKVYGVTLSLQNQKM